jgi:hypothetical protein
MVFNAILMADLWVLRTRQGTILPGPCDYLHPIGYETKNLLPLKVAEVRDVVSTKASGFMVSFTSLA